MKKTKKFALGGLLEGEEGKGKKAVEARKVDSVPDGYTAEPIDPAYPNRRYYRKEQAAEATPVAKTTSRLVSTPRRTATASSRPIRTATVKPQTQYSLDRLFTETTPQVVTPQVNTPVQNPVEAFMGDIVVDPSNKAIGRLRNRSRNLAVGAGTNDTSQEAADFMYIQPDVKGAPVDSTRGKFTLNTKELQDIFGTGRVMTKDVSGYKSRATTKMANGGQVGADIISSAGKPLLDMITGLIDGTPQYSAQPIVNANAMKNMATPYSFAMGGSVDDLSEEQLAELQEQADQQGITVEELLAQMEQEPDEEVDPNELEPDEDIDDEGSGGVGLDDLVDGNYAYGGRTGKRIEIEGGEVTQTPDGTVMKHSGPSHENGGIPMNAPNGTKVYSDRLSIDGKTMQERKINREKKLAKLQKLVVDGIPNSLTKNTIKRTAETTSSEEQQDMAIQEVANRIYGNPGEAAYGTKVGSYYGVKADPLGAPEYDVPLGLEGIMAASRAIATNNMKLPGTSNLTINPQLAGQPANAVPKQSLLSIGDMIGMGGTAFNAIAPLVNSSNANANRKPNINRFLGFGHDALETNDAAQDYVAGQQSAALSDNQLAANTAYSRNHNNASSVNTQRALDATVDMTKSKADNETRSTFARQMMGILGQRSGISMRKDQMEMSGQAAMDLADKQDMDNFYTNKGADLVNFGNGIQAIGRNLNIAKSNQTDRNLVGSLSKYGLDFDDDGNLISKSKK